MLIQNPKILKNVFDEKDFNNLKSYLYNKPKLEINFDKTFGRYCFEDPFIDSYSEKILQTARDVFNSQTLLPSYFLFAHYEGPKASLYSHVDDNACTYTIDMCIYQTEPWDLYVDGEAYTLHENEALAYYGNDQRHWREKFPNPESQHVAMIFFHFVEPDHWFYTKNKDYIWVLRKTMPEEEWKAKYGLL